jgi:hypothetical protein
MDRKKNAAVIPASLAGIIDVAAETATSAAMIDHHSQSDSWRSDEQPSDADASLDREYEEERLVPYDIDPEASAELNLDATDPVVTEEQLLEQVVSNLEAIEVQEPEAVTEPVHDEPAEPATFAEVLDSFAEEDIEAKVWATKRAVDERETFERRKDPDNTNIQRTLKKVRSALVTMRAAKVLLATNVDPGHLLNRSVHDGSCYNVYALGKVADLVVALTGGEMANAINIACMRSLFRFRAAGVPFTMEAAKGACSKQYRVDEAIRSHLVRHTVSPSTAPTQASSTMQALVTLGVVTTSGSGRNPTYTLTDTPLVRALEEVLKAA